MTLRAGQGCPLTCRKCPKRVGCVDNTSWKSIITGMMKKSYKCSDLKKLDKTTREQLCNTMEGEIQKLGKDACPKSCGTCCDPETQECEEECDEENEDCDCNEESEEECEEEQGSLLLNGRRKVKELTKSNPKEIEKKEDCDEENEAYRKNYCEEEEYSDNDEEELNIVVLVKPKNKCYL